jgi:PAS domain S-box-containing protein|tara:strand:- start:23233 stop:26577 length:3345 start_codon:yes stop_codon:yes gene_type:complete
MKKLWRIVSTGAGLVKPENAMKDQNRYMVAPKFTKRTRTTLHRLILTMAAWFMAFNLLAFPVLAQANAEDRPAKNIKIGILVSEGVTRALDSWVPMAATLNAAAQAKDLAYKFEVAPFTDGAMIDRIHQGELDLFLVDPAAFVVAEVEDNARPLLSAAQVWDGQTYDQTGVVVFTKSDSDIRSIPDVSGRSIMGVAANEMTGWKLALQEFRKYRLDIADISARALFSGGNQREVVYAVQTGLVDVGVIRAGVLENLARSGVINLDDFRPLSPVSHEGYPFWVSTQLYPDWIMAAMPGVPEDVLALVIDTLLGQNGRNSTSVASGGTVWLPPQNYQSVHELLISLRARPYENYLQRSAVRIAATYKWLVLGVLLLIVLSLLFLIFQLRQSARQANARKDVLKSEVKSKEFYRTAVEAHTVFCMLSHKGIISYANTQFQDAIGRSRANLINKPLVDLLDERNQDTFHTEIFPAMETGTPWRGTLLLQKENGKSLWLQCSFVPVMENSKQLSEIAIVASDMTETREGVSEARFNNTLELLQDHVVVFSPRTYTLMYVNSSVTRHLLDERLGASWKNKSLSELIKPQDFESLKTRCEALIEGPERRVTWEVETRAGTTYEISLEYACPAQDEPRFIAIYRDASQRKVAEKAKSEFVSTVSHELRTPLTSIKGALGLVLSGATGQLPDKMKGLVSMAAASCDRLILLINSILDLEKIEAGTLDYRMTAHDLSDTLESVLLMSRQHAGDSSISIRRVMSDDPGPFLTFGDPKRLQQALENLMSNATKFSDAGAEVLVSLKRMENRLRITIRDFGAGIPRSAQGSIFEKFTQADSSDSRSKGGTGLGLTIAKAIIEHHKGRISFFSQEGIGTEIVVDLPSLASEEAPALPEEPMPKAEVSAFSADLSSEVNVSPAMTPKTAAQCLLQQVTASGFDPTYDFGKINIAKIASGADTTKMPLIEKWITPAEKTVWSELLQREQILEAKLCLVEITSDADHSVFESTVTAAKQLRSWLTQCAEHLGGPPQPKIYSVTENPEIAEWLVGQNILTFNSVVELTEFAETAPADLVLTVSEKAGAALVAASATRQGLMPDGWPTCILAVNNVSQRTVPGVVSKFSSSAR